MAKVKCESCGKLNSPSAEKCRRCGHDLSPPSLSLVGAKKQKKKKKLTSSPPETTEIQYSPDFTGGQLEAIHTFFVRPSEASSLFFSRFPPPIYLPLFITFVLISFHAFVITTKVDYTYINGEAVDKSIPIFSNIIYSVFIVVVQYVIGSFFYGFAFSTGFEKNSIGYHRPVKTFFRVNAYIWLIHAASALVMIFATLGITENKILQFDLANNTQTTIRAFPTWYTTLDSIMNYSAVVLAAIALYRTMRLTFKMGNGYALVGVIATLLPVFFPLVRVI